MRIKVISCIFKSNAGYRGAAIRYDGGSLVISDSTFENNSNRIPTSLQGGVIYFTYRLDTRTADTVIGEFSCNNCTFLNNSGTY